MSKDKTKVYLYTRVSTLIQVDGYSLDAQKSKMKAFCEYNDYEIAGEYEDAGKSGKSTEGRVSFNRMMDDIKSGKINMEVDTFELDQEIADYEKQLRQCCLNKDAIIRDLIRSIMRISIIRDVKTIWRTGFIVHMIKWTRWKIFL